MATVLSGAQVSPSGQPGPQGIPAIPIGSVFDFAGPTAPSGYLLCYGQAVSRTTFAALFSALGTTYGAGDGTGTTFNLPDCRGRVTAGDDDMGGTAANRITNSNSGFDGKAIGAAGGTETFALLTGHLPAHQHPGVDHVHGIGQHQHLLDVIPNSSLNGNYGLAQINCGIPCGVGFNGQVMIHYGSAMWSGNSNLGATGAADRSLTTGVTGSDAPHRNVQPTIVFNKIIFTGVFS